MAASFVASLLLDALFAALFVLAILRMRRLLEKGARWYDQAGQAACLALVAAWAFQRSGAGTIGADVLAPAALLLALAATLVPAARGVAKRY